MVYCDKVVRKVEVIVWKVSCGSIYIFYCGKVVCIGKFLNLVNIGRSIFKVEVVIIDNI